MPFYIEKLVIDMSKPTSHQKRAMFKFKILVGVSIVAFSILYFI